MALIVTTLLPETAADVIGGDRLACDLLEIRLDSLDPQDIEKSIQGVQTPVLASCRREADGGVQALDEDTRHQRLQAALAAGADLVDVEHDAPFREDLQQEALEAGAQVIVSEHDLTGTPTPEEAMARLEGMQGKADIIKLATRAERPEDVQFLFETALKAPTLGTPFTIMGVGDATLRACAGPLGMALVYTSPGRAQVPGQLSVALQRTLPKHPPPPEGFRDYVLLGYPVRHSLSPMMQNAAFSHLGEGARYRLQNLSPEKLEAGFGGLKALGVAGGNVTSPHKGAVYELCDEVRPVADAARAVNTFRLEDDIVSGTNTDGKGIVKALTERGEALDDRTVLLAGAGGTARAAAHALTGAGAHLTLANRTAEKAQDLAREVGAEHVPLDPDALTKALPEGALLVNATPVDLAIPDEVLARTMVFDATYGPGKAALARR
ncbi:MAG: type I 3-dehydroquinate dehydratase, partial [Candidatus Thermoplasmatota archaeon]|nr:type I 3-dehydroquinate dehydratase [Candidatus Thermoplasmatota archaeon]